MRRAIQAIDNLKHAYQIAQFNNGHALLEVKYRALLIYCTNERAKELIAGLTRADIEGAEAFLRQISKTVSHVAKLAADYSRTDFSSPDRPQADLPIIAEFTNHATARLATARRLLSAPPAAVSVDRLAGIFHSIQTLAGFLDLAQMAGLAASAEKLLRAVKTNHAPLNATSLDLLQTTLDSLSGMTAVLREFVCSGHAPPPPPQFGLENLVTRLDALSSDPSGNIHPD